MPPQRLLAIRLLAIGSLLPGLACTRVDAQQPRPGATPRSAASITDMRVHDASMMEARAALLGRAEAELARGDAASATESFDRAAMMLHAPDTELGLVRAAMQLGHYRRALAFCAHTAQAHLESPAAGALYAWLLRAGGQGAVADRVLDETIARSPQDEVSLAVRRAFEAPRPIAADLLLQAPHRMAPPAAMAGNQPPIPEAVRVASSGVLAGGGTQALVPASVARSAPGGVLWVRNGLGQASSARIEDGAMQTLERFGVVVLRLDASLDAAEVEASETEPFAGSPAFAIEYAETTMASPAWPWLRQGFLGSAQGNTGLRRLGIEITEGLHGGPVLDAKGHLAGIALQGPGHEALMLPSSQWAPRAGMAANAVRQPTIAARPTGPSLPLPADEAYERGLRLALQVIVPLHQP